MICPVCRRPTALTDVRAGRFRVECPRCGSPLILSVEVDPDVSVAVELDFEAKAKEKEKDDEARSGAAPVVVSRPEPRLAFAPGLDRPRWLGRYRVRGGWDAVRAGVGSWGRWLGAGPTAALASTRDRWGADPRFVARWTLEAFASTRLHHPNLAGPFAVEVAGNQVFAVAAFDESSPLSDPVEGRASLDRQARVAAILHAARGLRFAHEQGVFHRDLGLGAIRVDPEGRVAVTGVGVGLVPALGATDPQVPPISLAGASASTPVQALPSPPDAEADVVALGQALSTLVAGSSGDRAVPPGLAGVIRRMVGGEGNAGPAVPPDRFRDMGAVVRALESELGVDGPLTPTEAEAEAFESALLDYQTAPLLPVRRWVGPSSLAILAAIVLATLASGRAGLAAGWLIFGGLIAAALARFRGFDARSKIKPGVARTLAVSTRSDGIALAVVGLLALGALVITHQLGTWITLTTLAVGLAAAYHFGLDRPLERSRSQGLARLKALVRGWRRLGVDESAIRRYVAGAGGAGWEEVFGALFGFGATAQARGIWGLDLSGRRRPRFAPVRGWISGRLEGLILGRTFDRTRGLLEPIFERDLEARGVHLLTARRKSKRAAEAVVAVASQFDRSLDGSVGLPLLEAFRKAVDHPEEFLLSPEIADAAEPSRRGELTRFYYETLLGRRMRFLLGLIALAGALIWMEQNNLVSFDQLQRMTRNVALEGDWPRAAYQAREAAEMFRDRLARIIETRREPVEMHLSFLPFGLTRLINGFALVASALILITSSPFRGRRIIPYALIAAAIPLTPPLVFPLDRPLGPLALAAMALGAVVFAVGLWLRRGRTD